MKYKKRNELCVIKYTNDLEVVSHSYKHIDAVDFEQNFTINYRSFYRKSY